MKLIDRYIFREILTPTLIALMTLTFVLVGRRLSALLELIVRRSASGEELWAITAAILPGRVDVHDSHGRPCRCADWIRQDVVGQ